VLHATSLPGNPYDGHTLASVINDTEKLTGRTIERIFVDKGIAATTRPIPDVSSSPAKSAPSLAPSSANCDADPRGRHRPSQE
jgi:hypothetical protein